MYLLAQQYFACSKQKTVKAPKNTPEKGWFRNTEKLQEKCYFRM